MGEIRNNKENLWAINIESEIKDLRVNVLEEEEEEGDTGDERVEGEGKDYETNLNGSSGPIENDNNHNMEITENTIENRNDYESRKCIHGLKNEQRKKRNETKYCVPFRLHYVIEINQEEEEVEEETFILAVTKNLARLISALFYKASFEWWYEESECILLKGYKDKRL
uniref:Uncharacterized protein n=1 Tax=Vespula pensylvanica TaxID=30213 RepID=A0A834JMX0_VESPE|nr:hypothetical protein H0235_017593 [Vespula pensylvanica]